jgi:hypothetical protein
VLLADRTCRRIVAALIFLQLLLDGFFWGHPMLLWTEGPGSAPFLDALIGRSLTAIVPTWENLNGPVLLASLVGLGICAGLTWTILGADRGTAAPVHAN